MNTRSLFLAVGLLLAGCEKTADKGDGAAVSGEVLPGSISDDMIDLDTSTASPPLAPVLPKARASSSAQATSADEPAVAEAAPAAAAPSPAAPAAASADTQ